jgi:hypothetical protein
MTANDAIGLEVSRRTPHEFIAYWNNVAGMERVWAEQVTLPRATSFADNCARVALQRCPILRTGDSQSTSSILFSSVRGLDFGVNYTGTGWASLKR